VVYLPPLDEALTSTARGAAAGERFGQVARAKQQNSVFRIVTFHDVEPVCPTVCGIFKDQLFWLDKDGK
jgi:hypothetical protein